MGHKRHVHGEVSLAAQSAGYYERQSHLQTAAALKSLAMLERSLPVLLLVGLDLHAQYSECGKPHVYGW